MPTGRPTPRRLAALLPLLLMTQMTACGGGGTGSAASGGASRAPSGSAAYELHEWGVIAVRPGSFEVAAGAGQRASQMAIAVDKPVLYVHPEGEAPFDLRVTVRLPGGLSVAEHFPPTDSLSPLQWQARVEHQGCHGSYPVASDGVDGRCLGGYCEVYELGTYEAQGAACLSVGVGEGAQRAPLLFYRLWAPDAAAAPPLPLEPRADGQAVIVRNRGGLTAGSGPLGQLWRITREGAEVRASASPIPAAGQELRIGPATGDALAAHRAMIEAIRAQGLTQLEAEAFDRGWGEALFGAAVMARSVGPSAADEDDGDAPARPPDVLVANDETQLDRLGADDLPADPGLPRDADVLLYWLPAPAIDAFAAIEAEPAPRHLRRAFLVRVVLR